MSDGETRPLHVPAIPSPRRCCTARCTAECNYMTRDGKARACRLRDPEISPESLSMTVGRLSFFNDAITIAAEPPRIQRRPSRALEIEAAGSDRSCEIFTGKRSLVHLQIVETNYFARRGIFESTESDACVMVQFLIGTSRYLGKL